MTPSANIHSERCGAVGIITLDRPRALNALDLKMVQDFHSILDEWDPFGLSAIVIQSSNLAVFCAGGDIKRIQQLVVDGDSCSAYEFFRREYELNLRLKNSKTPIVSLIGGICFGGGLGLSVHGTVRIVSDDSQLAMPETAIGFFPDVGASYFLSRLPGELGMYLGLTGYRLDYRDALYSGLATHYVPTELLKDSDQIIGLLQKGPFTDSFEVAVAPRTVSAGGVLHENRATIDRCFAADSIEEIQERLAAAESRWAQGVLEQLSHMSPQSLRLTHRLIRQGRDLSLRECLAVELSHAKEVIQTDDFREGVRAILIDKDHHPFWLDEIDTLRFANP